MFLPVYSNSVLLFYTILIIIVYYNNTLVTFSLCGEGKGLFGTIFIAITSVHTQYVWVASLPPFFFSAFSKPVYNNRPAEIAATRGGDFWKKIPLETGARKD